MCCGMLRHASNPPPTGPQNRCCGMLQPLVLAWCLNTVPQNAEYRWPNEYPAVGNMRGGGALVPWPRTRTARSTRKAVPVALGCTPPPNTSPTAAVMQAQRVAGPESSKRNRIRDRPRTCAPRNPSPAPPSPSDRPSNRLSLYLPDPLTRTPAPFQEPGAQGRGRGDGGSRTRTATALCQPIGLCSLCIGPKRAIQLSGIRTRHWGCQKSKFYAHSRLLPQPGVQVLPLLLCIAGRSRGVKGRGS